MGWSCVPKTSHSIEIQHMLHGHPQGGRKGGEGGSKGAAASLVFGGLRHWQAFCSTPTFFCNTPLFKYYVAWSFLHAITVLHGFVYIPCFHVHVN